jgi:hypothetical protein
MCDTLHLASIGEVYHIFREELIPMLLKVFHDIEREQTFLNTFCEATIAVIPKLDKEPGTNGPHL